MTKRLASSVKATQPLGKETLGGGVAVNSGVGVAVGSSVEVGAGVAVGGRGVAVAGMGVTVTGIAVTAPGREVAVSDGPGVGAEVTHPLNNNMLHRIHT